MNKTIYDLELHEILTLTNEVRIQRVPGGWNYIYYQPVELKQIVFVPYNKEFDECILIQEYNDFLKTDLTSCCKIGPITKENYCPKCGKKINREVNKIDM